MSRKILLKQLPTTDPDRILEVEVYYDEGGMSYFTGSVNKRGYYLAVQPVKLDGGFRSITAFSGTKALVPPAFRDRGSVPARFCFEDAANNRMSLETSRQVGDGLSE